jgi:aerobic carbon-monoxide dehydrogenase medium subunit
VLDEGGVCRDARVVLGIATPRPTRLVAVEAALLGRCLTLESTRSAAVLAGEIALREDVRASEQYLRRLVPVVVGRALAKACGANAHGANEVTA